jgi:hypothetical protein
MLSVFNPLTCTLVENTHCMGDPASFLNRVIRSNLGLNNVIICYYNCQLLSMTLSLMLSITSHLLFKIIC